MRYFLLEMLLTAIAAKETRTVSKIMNHFLAAFIEGDEEWEGNAFNAIFSKLLSKEMQQQTIDDCLFESFTIEMAEKYNLESPYVITGISEYGLNNYKRVRPKLDVEREVEDIYTIISKMRMK